MYTNPIKAFVLRKREVAFTDVQFDTSNCGYLGVFSGLVDMFFPAVWDLSGFRTNVNQNNRENGKQTGWL